MSEKIIKNILTLAIAIPAVKTRDVQSRFVQVGTTDEVPEGFPALYRVSGTMLRHVDVYAVEGTKVNIHVISQNAVEEESVDKSLTGVVTADMPYNDVITNIVGDELDPELELVAIRALITGGKILLPPTGEPVTLSEEGADASDEEIDAESAEIDQAITDGKTSPLVEDPANVEPASSPLIHDELASIGETVGGDVEKPAADVSLDLPGEPAAPVTPPAPIAPKPAEPAPVAAPVAAPKKGNPAPKAKPAAAAKK